MLFLQDLLEINNLETPKNMNRHAHHLKTDFAMIIVRVKARDLDIVIHLDVYVSEVLMVTIDNYDELTTTGAS